MRKYVLQTMYLPHFFIVVFDSIKSHHVSVHRVCVFVFWPGGRLNAVVLALRTGAAVQP